MDTVGIRGCSGAGCLHPYRRHLNISVDVEPVVLAGQHHATVVHQRYVETLGVLHLHQIFIFSNCVKHEPVQCRG